MRTTLAIDDDVLMAAKAIAEQRHVSIGQVVSDLARRALHSPPAPATRKGVTLLPWRDASAVATLETVNAIRDDLP
jgi:hypothetical protein